MPTLITTPSSPVTKQPGARLRAEYLADGLAAFGAANVAYITHLAHITSLGTADLFWMEAPPAPQRYIALFLNILLLSVAVFSLIRAVRHAGVWGKIGSAFLCVFSVICLNSIRDYLSAYYPELGANVLRRYSRVEVLLVLMVAMVFFVVAIRYFRRQLAEVLRHALMGVGVLGMWNVAHASWDLRKATPFPPASHAEFLPSAPQSPKIVWLVFDELDYRLLFVDRQPGLSLPVLDDLRKTTVFSSAAYPPSSSTNTSLLSLMTGKRISSFHVLGLDDVLMVTAEQPAGLRWTQTPNLFSEARRLGVNGAAVGWYLPYSRLLKTSAVDTWWFDKSTHDRAVRGSVMRMLTTQPQSLLETSLLSPFGQSLLTKRRVRNLGQFMDKTRQLLADSRVGLLLLHIPVPHTPFIYDRRTGRETRANSLVDGYWDALALVDRILGEVRYRMQQSGDWDRATILVTSDHYNRDARVLDGHVDRRVPYMLKMPGQHRALSFNQPFNTQLSHDLLLEILSGKVRTEDDALRWLTNTNWRVPVGWGVPQPSAPDALRPATGG